MENKPMKTAVIGCGVISEIYLKNMTSQFDNLDVVACCDLDSERAEKRASQFGISSRTLEDILADTTIELVIVLTPAPAHYGLIKKALLAGKHVYTEKTMTIDLEQARELVQLANEKHLYLGAAPDTFLGAALQKAAELIRQGVLGEITSFQVCSNRNLDNLASRYTFLRMPGGGICHDYGVYFLTALVSLLGSMDSVAAVVENRKPIRYNVVPNSPDFGKPFDSPNESQVSAILKTKSGITGTFTLNGESLHADLCVFTIYGTQGILKLTNPNFFGGNLVLVKMGPRSLLEEVIENDLPYADNNRGLGPAEMVEAIREGRPNKASKELAFHVLDIIEQIIHSGKTGRFEKISSEYNP